jgi:hypothetical protein
MYKEFTVISSSMAGTHARFKVYQLNSVVLKDIISISVFMNKEVSCTEIFSGE